MKAVGVKERPVLSERVKRLRQSLLQAKPKLCCERLRFLLESYKETDGQPPVIRQAKAFEKILRRMTIVIDDNPIVGSLTPYPVGVLPFPEASCIWMAKAEAIFTDLGRGDRAEEAEEDRRLLLEAVDYWKDKCALSRTHEYWHQKYGEEISRNNFLFAGAWQDSIGHPIGGARICVDYGKVLNKGLNGVIAEAKEELNKLPLASLEASTKRDFLNAVIIAANAVITLAHRYASLARDMAQKEENPRRRQELKKIAETGEWVPANPARTFYEAMQSFWFTHLATHLEANSTGKTIGRFPQYMYPFYQKDKQQGKITEEEAIELIELLFIKITQIVRPFESLRQFEETMSTPFQNLAIGGVTEDGQDATNELDFLIVEAQKRVQVVQPTISLLYHDNLSQEFLLKCVELVKTGVGMPAFFNNNLVVHGLVYEGASLEEARNGLIMGCVERGFSHASSPSMGGALNMAKVLELALNNGKDPRTGKLLGIQTGETFQSYEELSRAVKKQLEHQMRLLTDFDFTGHAVHARLLPLPFSSALIDDCIKNGMSMWEGGSRYSNDCVVSVAMVDLADSLTAIKKLVFEEKKITMTELMEALQANFAGKEELHRMLLEAPKYGNDDEYADKTVQEWYSTFCDEARKYTDHLGKPITPFAISATWHFPFGALTGALPNGRKAKVPLTDASVSPEPGKDTNGPTALIRSAAKALDTTKWGCNQLNMKFHPSALETKEEMIKFLSLNKTYMDLGGYHVQFNVVSADTLKDAQINPENYRDLIVRVAGFSAFFIHLDPVVQNEIIKRTELKFAG